MARNYAALPWEYLNEMKPLTDEEFGRLCRALLEYSSGADRDPSPKLTGNEIFLWARTAAQEDRFQASYSSVIRSCAGKKGAKNRWHPDEDDSGGGKASQTMANDGKVWQAMANDGKNGYTDTETDTKTENNTETTSPVGDDKRARRFNPPSVAEVQAYVSEKGLKVDPQTFVDFYSAKGWYIGKTPMKDWKAACRNANSWERWKPKSSDTPIETGKNNINPADFERMSKLLTKLEQ